MGGAEHRLMLGADFRKNFGDVVGINKDYLNEVFFYYQASLPLANGDLFRLYAGVIPSEYRMEDWNTLFYSEKRNWQDPYTEGIMLQYSGAGKGAELSCDWLGMYGASPSVKEQFLISSAAHYDLVRWLRIGYNGYMMHFASSQKAPGVQTTLCSHHISKSAAKKEKCLKAGI